MGLILPDHLLSPLVRTVTDLEPASASPSVQRLYGSPKIIEGEALSGWLYRVASHHRIHLRLLLNLLGINRSTHCLDFGSTWNHRAIPAMASVTLNTPGALLSAISPPIHLLMNWLCLCLTNEMMPMRPIYRVCTRCLGEDRVPYIRRIWRLAYWLVCDQHPQSLMGTCQRCRNSLDFSKNVILRDRQRQRADAIRHCPHCSTDLTNMASPPLDPVLWKRLVQFQGDLHRVIVAGQYRHPRYGTISAMKFLENFLIMKRPEGEPRDSSPFSGMDFRRCFGAHATQVSEAIPLSTLRQSGNPV